MAKRGTKDGYSTEFQYNDLTVVVSRSVLQAWEAQRDKQEEMIASLLKHYDELDRAKRRPITEGIACVLTFRSLNKDRLFPCIDAVSYPEMKNRVLGLLKYNEFRHWHVSPIREVLRPSCNSLLRLVTRTFSRLSASA